MLSNGFPSLRPQMESSRTVPLYVRGPNLSSGAMADRLLWLPSIRSPLSWC